MSGVRDNWRVLLLVVLLLGSAVAIFVPGVVGDGSTQGPTNLQYGIELDGGSRIRAPIVGMTAEVRDQPVNQTAVTTTVVAELGVESQDVLVRQQSDPQSGQQYYTVELFVDNVTNAEFAGALQQAGLDVTAEDVSDSVTQQTRDEMVETIRTKISEAGFAGREVRIAQTPTGEHFVVVEVPSQDPDRVKELLSERGQVQIDAYYRTQQNGTTVYQQTTVLTDQGLKKVGGVQQDQRTGNYFVPLVISDEAAGQFQQDMVEYGFGGGSTCTYQAAPNSTGSCLLIVSDGEVVNSYGVAPPLGDSFADGTWADDPRFRIVTGQNYTQARDVRINLQAGSLRAPLDFEAGTTFSLQPALAENFKMNSLLVAIIAILAVSFVVYLRYDDPRVAAPMVVTALSEVVLLLGFASLVQLQLDLSHIAGFIAVIGTGVDDLVIIADEVLSEGDVNSARVFQSRFRRAFWVIAAAAATTIIALSPLAVLSLGDLQGFAIVAILGVVLGVLVTRPAYGDILRTLTTDR